VIGTFQLEVLGSYFTVIIGALKAAALEWEFEQINFEVIGG